MSPLFKKGTSQKQHWDLTSSFIALRVFQDQTSGFIVDSRSDAMRRAILLGKQQKLKGTPSLPMPLPDLG